MNRNIVEQIVNKIPPQERRGFTLSREIKDRTEEQLRILETKVSMGRLGPGDSREARAAIVLENIVKHGSNHKFSLAALSSALGMKKNKFETLYTKVGNYLSLLPHSDTAPNTNKRKNSDRKAGPARKLSKRAARGNATAHTRSSARAAHVSSIPSLAIKLGSLVPDSHGFGARAEQLLRDIHAYEENNSNVFLRRRELQDLHRRREVYEAACFYVVVTRATTTNAKKGRKSSTIEDDPLEDAATEERQLEKKDVIYASNVSESAFNDVLKRVEDLATKIASSKKDPPPRVPTQESTNGSSTRIKPSHDKEMEEPPSFEYSQKFKKWKEEVLSRAVEEAKPMLQTSPGEKISSSRAMEYAAEQVLCKHGIFFQ